MKRSAFTAASSRRRTRRDDPEEPRRRQRDAGQRLEDLGRRARARLPAIAAATRSRRRRGRAISEDRRPEQRHRLDPHAAVAGQADLQRAADTPSIDAPGQLDVGGEAAQVAARARPTPGRPAASVSSTVPGPAGTTKPRRAAARTSEAPRHAAGARRTRRNERATPRLLDLLLDGATLDRSAASPSSARRRGRDRRRRDRRSRTAGRRRGPGSPSCAGG